MGFDVAFVYMEEYSADKSTFMLKVDNIIGCVEKLKYDKFYEESFYDVCIVTDGDKDISIRESFRVKEISNSDLNRIKDFIFGIIDGNRKNSILDFG